MRSFGRFRQHWIPASILIGSAVVAPIAASSGQIFYRAYLTSSLTVRGVAAALSIVRAAPGSEASPSGVTIHSHGDVPYTLFINQDSDAPQISRGAANSGSPALQLCRDPACTTVWTPHGDAQTGIIVTPGSASTALPLSVIRSGDTRDDGSTSEVLLLTMYF